MHTQLNSCGRIKANASKSVTQELYSHLQGPQKGKLNATFKKLDAGSQIPVMRFMNQISAFGKAAAYYSENSSPKKHFQIF